MSAALPVLSGATVLACAVAALFFLRFFRSTGEPLFARFALSFGLLGLHWLALAVTAPDYEFRPLLYVVRLLAFVVILFAIAEKNRATTPVGAGAPGTS
jgi:hypothetical protein